MLCVMLNREKKKKDKKRRFRQEADLPDLEPDTGVGSPVKKKKRR